MIAKKNIWLINRILLGLLMLIPGLLKLFVSKPSGVVAMLSGIGFPAATFFAWLLIIAEIVTGVLILANYKLKWSVIPPMIILLVAVISVYWGKWPTFLLHIVAISNYWLLMYKQ